MAAGDDDRNSGRASRARALAVAVAGRRPAQRWDLMSLGHAAAARLARDLAAESASGRLVLWLPVAFTGGILAYFGAHHEPWLPAVLLITAVLAGVTIVARRHPLGFGLSAGALAFALGFAAGGVRTAMVNHDIIEPPRRAVQFSGFVEQLERRAKSDRILLRLDDGMVSGVRGQPRRVRLSLRRGAAPDVGTHVTQLTRLLPPQGPAMAGGHDFGRGPWFQGIDASGFGLGRPRLTPGPAAVPLTVRLAALVASARAGLSERIRAGLHGVSAEIAVALVAGERAGIPHKVEESMRVSGLTHILSISGLHMAMVAGTLFALVRGVLALVPTLALGWPIKAIAAVAALAGSAGYLVLSGNDVPAQRSFVMTALVLGGVLAGRRALTLRTVAVAAFVVLGLTPEAALEPGTQMSFSATLALIAAYERLQPLRAVPRPEGIATRIALAPLLFFAGIVMTALVAGAASGPYGAYHFHRIAPYGVLANLAAMPAVSLLVMPFGLIGVLLMPFGWDFLAWPVMGVGIDIMVAVSDHVAALPGADVRVEGLSTAGLLWFTLALLCLCLLRGSLTFLAAPALATAFMFSAPAPRPDVLIAPNAATVAVRGKDGRLSVTGARSERFMVDQWLTQAADHRTSEAADLADGFVCDPLGCVAPLRSGGTLAVSRRAEGLAADCLNSRIVVTRDPPPKGCPAKVITPADFDLSGPLALFISPDGVRIETARDPSLRRPWIPRRPEPTEAPEGDAKDTETLVQDDAATP